jgi:chemosensory pili system protein ChpA (sensor histidine kinase/response regulator)
MSVAHDMDLGPLTWVKGEIDLALGRTADALEKYSPGAAETTQLKFAQTHLHQARGALAIVGLYGLTQFAEALEQLLGECERGKLDAAAHTGLCSRALEAISQFLDDLASGGPNLPLKLFPLYREIQQARGQEQVSPTDLFFPDLSVRPPKRDATSLAASPIPLTHQLKTQRSRFERGILLWLRSRDESAGIAEMRQAVSAIESLQSLPANRAFWWVTLAFLDVLAEKRIPIDLQVKRLCGRIDAQMRRLVDGSKTVAERLMRDVLYYVALAEGGNDHVKQVKSLYRLDPLMPKPEAKASAEGLSALQLRELSESITGLKESWDRFCSGSAVALPQFDEQLTNFVGRVAALNKAPIARLVESLRALTQWLRRDPLQCNDTVAIEVATSLLLIDTVIEGWNHPDAETVAQAEIMAERVSVVQSGESVGFLQAPLLGEMSRRAQEQLVLSQVAREIQTNLSQIEQTLDAYFRDTSRRDDLMQIVAPIKQVMGALTVLNHPAAVDLLRECESRISEFASSEAVPQEQFEDVAQKLSALGFFVESLQQGRPNLELLRPLRSLGGAEEIEEVDSVASTVEQELEQQKRDAQALVIALRDKPEDDALRRELKQNLELIRQDANLLADATLERQAQEALATLASAPASAEIEEALGGIVQAEPDAAHVAAEVARLADSTAEEIDAELLGIFLEEAHDVLGSIEEHYQRSLAAPHDHETLGVIRRGFHTLKGSGRMVGLKDLGEAAWGIEQVMNRWLQQERDATPGLHKLLADAHSLMSDWVAQLEAHGGLSMDASAVLALAEQLKAGEEPAAAPSPISPAEAVQPAEGLIPGIEAQGFEYAQAGELPRLDQPVAAETSSLLVPEETGLDLAGAVSERKPGPTPAVEETVAVGDFTLSRGLYSMFLTEARGHVMTLRRELERLHLNPAQQPGEPILRAAHTLAGIAGTVRFDQVAQLARAVEHALRRTLEAGQALRGGESASLSRAVTSLEAMVSAVAERRLPQAESQLVEHLDRIVPATASEAGVAAEVDLPLSAEGVTALTSAAEAEERRKLRLQDDIDEQLLPVFLEESQDLVREIGAELRQWQGDAQDPQPPRALARLLHTLKGSARMAGAMGLGELVHRMETRIEQTVGRDVISQEAIEEFVGSFDRATQLLDQLRGGQAAALDATATAKAPTAVPQQAALLPTSLLEGTGVELAQPRASLRVRADLIDRFVNEAGEMSIARARIEGEMRMLRQSLLDLTENVIRLRRQLREIEIQAETQMQSRMAHAEETRTEFDPLEFDRFTRFQELSRMMAESVNDVSTVQHNLLKNLDSSDAALVNQARINRDLAQALMSVRMVPFNSVADRLYRVVRQTAKDLGKKANLDIRGGQIECDRSLLEKMVAPLEHLLRNAISHGLEPVAVRQALGKPDIGQISVQVTQEGNEVAVELADDGAGLDFDRIKRKAAALGLIGEDDAADEQSLTALVFRPGFSTAEELSEVAGRGIGMDVVKNQVTELGGRIDAYSERRKGARFRIYLPQSLAVMQALLIRSGGRTYAIPSSVVEQVLELKHDAFNNLMHQGSIDWQGNRYVFHYAARLLGDATSEPAEQRYHWVILVRGGTQRVALAIDELRGNQEIVLKKTGPQLARVLGITGASVLGDGDIVLIINPAALAAGFELRRSPDLVATTLRGTLSTARASRPTASTVMVVDDSLTVRKITGRLLEREGYRVLTAKDGVDALEQLLDAVPDVMLVDIEMPRMDGFDLTRNVRADSRLKDVPIIMVTSRTAEKHRRYAKEIGVNHYLGKPYQEEELLAKIAEYVGGRPS